MTGLPHRYLFVAGLHRTGTSLLARMIAAHSQISAIENAPVPEDEGAYLQGAIPHTALSGRPGHYATDPAQHFVEGDPRWQVWLKQGGGSAAATGAAHSPLHDCRIIMDLGLKAPRLPRRPAGRSGLDPEQSLI